MKHKSRQITKSVEFLILFVALELFSQAWVTISGAFSLVLLTDLLHTPTVVDAIFFVAILKKIILYISHI